MAKNDNNVELFDQLLFTPLKPTDWKPDFKYGFLIHVSMFRKFKKFLNGIIQYELGHQYELTIDQYEFDMKLIHMTRTTDEIFFVMNNLLVTTQFSNPWDENATLFRDTTSFHILENFIVHNKLQNNILKIQTTKACASKGLIIKIVKFDTCWDKYKLIDKYRRWIIANTVYRPSFYLVAKAFPWMQSQPIPTTFESISIYKAMPIFIQTYWRKMDIFQLVAIKLALFDFRYPLQSEKMIEKIDYLIERTLEKMIDTKTYIKSQIFDLEQYAIDHNVNTSDLVVHRFRYEYQKYFKSVIGKVQTMSNIQQFTTTKKLLKPHESVTHTVKLNEQANFVEIFKNNPSQTFIIDGRGCAQMNFQLFVTLLAFANVEDITLDTSYTCPHQTIKFDQTVTKNKLIRVHLIGTNQFYFVEDFLLSLKSNPSTNKMLDLHIHCPLWSYLRFDNLILGFLTLHNIQINSTMLTELNASNVKTRIQYINCTFENSLANWIILSNLKEVQMVEIRQDEYTWQSICEFVEHIYEGSYAGEPHIPFEYRSRKWIKILCDNGKTIDLQDLVYTIDPIQNRMDIWHDGTQRYLDVFHLQNNIIPDDRSIYDFYT